MPRFHGVRLPGRKQVPALTARNPSFDAVYDSFPEDVLQRPIEPEVPVATELPCVHTHDLPSTIAACHAVDEVIPVVPTASVGTEAGEIELQNLRESINRRASQRLSRRSQQPADEQTNEGSSEETNGNDEDEDDTCLICMGAFSPKHKRNRRIVNPCANHCNDSPVHARCIYQWQIQWQAHNGKHRPASCPLCRGPLLDIDYSPPDYLRMWSLKLPEPRMAFVRRPVPRPEGMIRCYIKVMSTGTWLLPTTTYEMWMQPCDRPYPVGPMPSVRGPPAERDVLLMSARRRLSKFGASRVDVFANPDTTGLTKDSHGYLGTLASSISGLEHTLVTPGSNTDRQMSRKDTQELVTIVYKHNRVAAPRRLNLAMPLVRRDPLAARATRLEVDAAIAKYVAEHPDEDMPGLDHDGDSEDLEEDLDEDSPVKLWANAAPAWASTLGNHVSVGDGRYLHRTGVHRPTTRRETLASRLANRKRASTHGSDVLIAQNIKPTWMDSVDGYTMDFRGRVTKSSIKNFQLHMDGVVGAALQFGKVAAREETGGAVSAIYTLDFQFPFSPLQALGVALSAFNRKVAWPTEASARRR